MEDNNNNKQSGLLNTIDFEINKIESEASRAGWSFWILLASLASLGWVLLEELGKSKQDWKYSLLVFLICSLVFEVLGNLRTLLLPGMVKPIPNRFFIASTVFGSSRILYLFALLRNIILVTIIFFVKDFIYLYQLLLVLYVLYTLTVLLVLLASFLDVPIRLTKNRSPTILTGIVVTIINSMVVVYLLNDIFLGKILINISEYKVGSIIFGVSFLVSNIITINQNVYQKEMLTNIRRDLLLGNIKLDEAKRQTEILLLGMQTSDFLQDDINAALELLQQLNNSSSESNKVYTEIIENIKARDIFSLQVDELFGFLESAKKLRDHQDDLENMKRLSNELVMKHEKIKRKLLLLRNVTSQDTVLDTLLGKFDSALFSNLEQLKTIKQYQDDLTGLLELIEKRVVVLQKEQE